MATSLENLGNEFEITNQENTTMAEKNESIVHMIGVMANFVQFWLCNPKFSCHGNLPCKFQKASEIGDLYATSRCKNIKYVVHTTGIMTNFLEL